ncbi:P-loop containing nucleoside triphosphate hydrolase protein, partial [Chytriomyces sp. MP71]
MKWRKRTLSNLSLLRPAIFSGIKNRFSTKEIYTYSGMALIAVNPFERVPIYGLDSMKQYADKSREEAAPHVYGIAEECYRAMLRGSNQSVIVSGESGAGKTQSTRYIMQYLASVDSLSGLEHTGSVLRSNETNEAVLASNPILESFGNAKTTRNDNSSRFGKFVQLYFSDSSNSCITGAKIKTYLLERSRLIFQASSERNYHIFYQLCSALEAKQKEKLGLTRWEDFEYLNQGNAGVVRTINDTTEFADLQEAMVKIGITQEIQSNIFKICSALLHLGNAKILPGETIDGNLDTETSVLSPKDPSLLKFCELVGTDPVLLVKWITNIQKDINREKIVKPLKLDSALIARDSVAKVIYMKLFDWLVDVINKNLAREYSPSQNFIGVLDIYGFEHFDINSFEQFCINYANEKLQQEFTRHVFRLEQEEYVSEGIAWNKIQFNDNQPCIDLIENRVGILSMLDDNSKANGTDQQFVGAMNNELAANGCFRKARFGADTFCVQHYALEVQYTAAGFIEKNRDTVSHELKEVLAASSDDFFKTVMEGLLAGAEAVPEVSSTPASKRRSTLAKTNTLGSMFKRDLESLMVTLRQTEGHYIRCIKPNAEKVAFKFDGPMVLGQLKACGVLETIRISNAGYPNKMTYEEFAEKFGLLLNEAEKRRAASPRDLCTMIIEFVLKDSLLYQFGENKVFFKSGQIAFFEDRRKDRLDALKMLVFRSGRAFLTRCKFLKTKRAAQTLQMVVRTYLAQKHLRLLVERKAATLQADARARAAVLIQTYWRGHRNRQAFLEKSRIICVLQKVIRSRAAVKRLRTLKTEAKDVGNMKLELATLRTQVAAISTEKKASEAVWFAKCASLESELQVLVAKVRDMEGSRAARDPNDERLTQSHSQNKEELKTILERLEMKEEELTELQAQLE